MEPWKQGLVQHLSLLPCSCHLKSTQRRARVGVSQKLRSLLKKSSQKLTTIKHWSDCQRLHLHILAGNFWAQVLELLLSGSIRKTRFDLLNTGSFAGLCLSFVRSTYYLRNSLVPAPVDIETDYQLWHAMWNFRYSYFNENCPENTDTTGSRSYLLHEFHYEE